MLIASASGMDCYFSARKKNGDNADNTSSIVMFHIPDVGIRFKAPFAGVDQDHSDLASLLALLEFIDSNQKYFSSTTFQVYGDNLDIINQVNGRAHVRRELEHLLQKTTQYREKYRFSLQWIPSRENTADDSLLD